MILLPRQYGTSIRALRSLHRVTMRLLHLLVFFLTFLGLPSYGASTSTSKPQGNVIIVNDPQPVNPIIKSIPHSHGDYPFQCSLPLEAADFHPSRIHSGIVDFFQRYANFRWFVRRHSNGEPPVLRVQSQNFCDPSSFGFCNDMAREMLVYLPQAIKDINNWLYTSPYNGSTLLFCPRYPPIGAIHLLLGVGDFGKGNSLAYVPHGINPDKTMFIYFNTKVFEKLAQQNPKWKIKKLVRTTLIHELVHTLQHGPNGLPIGGRVGTMERAVLRCDGRPPPGLLEGMADFVALKAGEPSLWWPARPHSSNQLPKQWDQGYFQTAYFLEWLEDVRIGHGAVGMLNNRIGRVGYFSKEESWFDPCLHQPDTWKVLFGSSVAELWDEYGQWLDTTVSPAHYVVDFFTHRLTLLVLTTVVFGVVYFPFFYEFAQDVPALRAKLYGTHYTLLYFVSILWLFRDRSAWQVKGWARQVTPRGTLLVSAIFLYFAILIWICFSVGMTILDAAVFGCCYDWFGWFLRQVTAQSEERAKKAGWKGRLNLSSRYDRVFAGTYGIYLAIVLWILRGMGISVPVTAIFGLICIVPVYWIHTIVLVIRRCFIKAERVARQRDRRGRRQTRGNA